MACACAVRSRGRSCVHGYVPVLVLLEFSCTRRGNATEEPRLRKERRGLGRGLGSAARARAVALRAVNGLGAPAGQPRAAGAGLREEAPRNGVPGPPRTPARSPPRLRTCGFLA